MPKSKRASGAPKEADLFSQDDKYDPAWMINDIRQHVKSWRELPATADWGVTPATRRLLDYWRNHQFASIRPSFCQREAAETIIWLTEVAASLPPRGLCREVAAAYIGVSGTKFDEMIRESVMPKPRVHRGRRLWDRSELDLAFSNLPHADEAVANPWDAVQFESQN